MCSCMPFAGLRQPWYAKLFAPAPDGADSSLGAAGMGARSQQSPDAAQLGAAGHPPPPAPAHTAAGAAAPSGVAAADLSSALEAFMGVNDEEDSKVTAAQPPAVNSNQSAADSTAAVPRSAAAAAPSIAAAFPPVHPRNNGYAALADGYLGAPRPVQSVPSAAATSTHTDRGALREEPGSKAAAPASAGLWSTDATPSQRAAHLGRPVSFQASRSLNGVRSA